VRNGNAVLSLCLKNLYGWFFDFRVLLDAQAFIVPLARKKTPIGARAAPPASCPYAGYPDPTTKTKTLSTSAL
jgi:hypothetical protein